MAKKKSKSKPKKPKAKVVKKKTAKRAAAKAAPAKKKKSPVKAKKSKKTAKRPASRPLAKKATAKPAKKKTVKKKKQTVGEGNYEASRAFDKDQAAFVKRNKDKIPAMGKAAEAALDGPEGDSLREAEATAADRSRE